MEVTRIIAEIDAQIAKLQQARTLLGGTQTTASVPSRGPGRPKKSSATAAPARLRRKRILSPEARKKIADAQKRRWAEHRKQSSK